MPLSPQDVYKRQDITSQNVRIVVSLDGIGNSEGMFAVEPRIYIDGVSGVGAVGDYEVNVRVSKS